MVSPRQQGVLVYQFRVTLRDSRPVIWRRFQVPGSISLHRLHLVLQVVMGWTNSHLYRFEINGEQFSEPDPDCNHGCVDIKNSRRTRLDQVITREQSRFLYEYDFGDSWEHVVLLEKIMPARPGVRYPVCLTGERACPLEDSGGIQSYEELVKSINDSASHREQADLLEWAGEDFDPDEFDVESINKALKARGGRSKPRETAWNSSNEPAGTNRVEKRSRRRERDTGASQPRDCRLVERDLRAIEKLIDGKDFASVDELNAYLQEITGDGTVPTWSPDGPLEKAQELVYQALETKDKRARLRLVMRAIQVCPDCSDAYVFLAEEAAETTEQARDLYRRGIEAGERVLGTDIFTAEEGNFWGLVKTRPYMRAKAGFADCLYYLGELNEAISHYRDLLRLNPGDGQGVRYSLLNCLVEKGDFTAAEELLQQFNDEVSAVWYFSHALVTFARKGDGTEARTQLREAIEINSNVLPYLLGERRMPRNTPIMVKPGERDEAIAYVAEFGEEWRIVPGAFDWLKSATRHKGLTK